jgi:stage III sporulation protein AA
VRNYSQVEKLWSEIKMMNTKEILNILPQSIREVVQGLGELTILQEVRIKVNKPLIFQLGDREVVTGYMPTQEDLKVIIQRISNYSIYAFEEEIKQGYITVRGGHRVGLCGICVMEGSRVKTIKNIASINIRISREVKGCSNRLIPLISKNNEVFNTIIISPPKCGKTTLLRDIARNLSDGMEHIGLRGKKVSIIDERSELAACFEGIPQMNVGMRTDVLDSCLKSEGIMMSIRSMAPDVVVCDEIGTSKDMESIIMAMNCGVSLITSIHGFGIEDLNKRMVFKDLLDNNVFRKAVVLSNRNGIGTIEYVYDFLSKETVWRK